MRSLLDTHIIKNLISTFIKNNDKKNNRYFLNYQTGLLDLFNSRINFNTKWYKKNALFFRNSYSIDFKKIYFSRNIAFVFINLKTLYNINNFNDNSIDISKFCFILSKISKYNWIIDFIVSYEVSPDIYKEIENNNYDYDALIQNNMNLISHYKILLDNINTFSLKSFNNQFNNEFTRNLRTFDKKKCIEYAQKYALNYNKEFKSFDKSGGDCTNFVSQAIWYGGIKQTKTWKPYTNPWLRVNELRNYLIYNNIAREYSSINKNSSGSIVQFYNKDRKTWTHSGIITYVSNNDILYCCHSYDKLNFPLSIAYPSIYPKIRIITPY
ncbi:amidase domain-containing protein [Clostridium thermobutyricum]|uniref:amidase domain-containing protein n=1 Tax=Clostridium thermobutyricum TaxID=29372 RepID=UPI002943F4C7|nr:amidase domain-containing protein [Clostridium thermobutyricum]